MEFIQIINPRRRAAANGKHFPFNEIHSGAN